MYHKLDEAHVEVLAGDIPKGIWEVAGSNICQKDAAGKSTNTVSLSKNIKELTVRLKRSISNFDTFGDVPGGPLVGMACSAVLGPFGGLASGLLHTVAGSSEFVCVGCELSDGRKFIARMRAKIYESWKKYK